MAEPLAYDPKKMSMTGLRNARGRMLARLSGMRMLVDWPGLLASLERTLHELEDEIDARVRPRA